MTRWREFSLLLAIIAVACAALSASARIEEGMKTLGFYFVNVTTFLNVTTA